MSMNNRDRNAYSLGSLPVSKVKIVHPCNAFAQSAGYESWVSAVASMKQGNVVLGQAPRAGARSMLDIQLFHEQISKEGLFTITDDLGFVSVGFRENFPADMVSRWEQECAKHFPRDDDNGPSP